MKYAKSVYFVKSFFAGMRLSLTGMKSNYAGMKSSYAGMRLNFTGIRSGYAGMKLNFIGIRLNSEVYIKTTFLQISSTPKIENNQHFTLKQSSVLIKTTISLH